MNEKQMKSMKKHEKHAYIRETFGIVTRYHISLQNKEI